jgi:hypothetical protein
MSTKTASTKIVELYISEPPVINSENAPLRAELITIAENGSLQLRIPNGHEFYCDWLETNFNSNIILEPGDRLLCIPPNGQELGIVLGRIGKYKTPEPEERVIIEAKESLTLKCGAASVELRKDGKAMVKGEDVLLRAKGTQRIRAGTVAIN